jgi:hypothetical protein
VVFFINEMTLSGRTIEAPPPTTAPIDIRQERRPEERALEWIIYYDPLQLIPHEDSPTSQFRVLQRYALKTMQLQQQFGQASMLQSSVTGDKWDECDWDGITCQLLDTGQNYGRQDCVTEIDMKETSVNGYIPADWGLLNFLTRVHLEENSIKGTLPATIGRWNRLVSFSANNNALSGSLPTSIGQWTALESFLVFDNLLTGTLPESVVSNWGSIREIDVSSNRFMGRIPDVLCDAINLTILFADCNFEVACNCCTFCTQ